MSSILNEGEDENSGGISSYLSGGMDGEQKRVRKVSMKHLLFKLINLLTFQNVITNTMFVILLLCEFTQFLGFVLYKLELSQTTTSQFGQVSSASTSNSTIPTSITKTVSLQYVSYLNIKDLLMEVRKSVTVESNGQLISFVIAGLALFIILINFVVITVLCKLAKDGYDALFASQGMKMMLKICGVAQMVMIKVLFLPLMIILISVTICSKDYSVTKPNAPPGSLPLTSEVFRSYYYGGYECWNIPHIVLTAICILFALALAAITCLISLLYNDIRFHSQLPWGSASTKAELIKTIIKILIAIALNIEMYDRWALLVCQCANIILVYLLIHSRWKFFYHSDRRVLIATVVLEAAYLWLSFAVTLINGAQLITLSYSLFVYLIISALAFAVLILVAFLNSKDSHRMLFHLPHLRSDYEFEQFFLRLQRHVADNKANNIDKIVIYGLLKDHQRNQIQRCSDPKCHCEQLFYLMSRNKLEQHLEQLHEMALERQHLLMRNDPKHNFEKVKNTKKDLDAKQIKKYEYRFRRLFFKFFYSLLSKRIDQQFPKSMRLKYLQVQVLQHELSNEFKSYFQILKLVKDKPSLEYQYFLYQSKQSVEHIMYRKYQNLLTNKQTIDVVKVYDFEELFIRFEKQIVNTANNCLNFWKELMDKRLDVNRIHDFGVQISSSFSEVNEITIQMVRLFPHHVQFQRIYAAFLGDVMNNENEAYEINQKVRSYLESSNNMHKLNYMNEDKFFGYNTGTVIITITVTPRDIGNIVNANFEAKKLLGYRHKELKSKNVRILMPKLLQDNHDSFLQNYFETAKAKILEVQRVVIAKDKDGYIIPSYILVKAIPNLKRNLTFVGFIRRLDESHAFMQPPTQYSSLDYHFVVTDTEGQIYGFSRNCWETFGFKPAFFFNQFGDPEQQIRMELIVKCLKDPSFLSKPELRKEGIFCQLDTSIVMENAPRELLSKEEQDLMINISGQYNINIQLEEMSFWNGRINLRIYKIVRLSRVPRSQNAFDEIGASTNNITRLSFESQEIDSQMGELNPNSGATPTNKKGQTKTGKNLKQEMFEDAKQDEGDYAVNHNDVNMSLQNESYSALNDRNGKGFDSSNDDSASSGANHSQSQQLVNFKKQISTKEMPQSIIKLNRLVLCIVIVILGVVIFDTFQNYQYYQFSEQSQLVLQNLYHKHYLISKISANVITMGLINMGLQNDNYLNFTDRRVTLRQKLLKDIEDLELMEESIQNSPESTRFGIYGLSSQFNQNPPMMMTLLNQDASYLLDPSQTMRYAVSQLIGKVGSTLQMNSSYANLFLPPELSTINQKLQQSQATNRNETAKSVFFIIYNSLRDLTSNTVKQIEDFHDIAFKRGEELNHWLLVSAFIFFCVFVVMSGFVIFPIVVGVQRNKVMILSIYFDLPMIEIKAVHQRCFEFLCKIDDEKRNEALMMAENDDQNNFNNDINEADEIAASADPEQNHEMTKRGETSRNTNRKLVDANPLFNRKKKTAFNQSQISDNLNASQKQNQDEVNEQEGTNNQEGEDKGENGDDGQLDHNKMLKDIKVSNNKLNMVTLSVILVFLTYFSTCFGISLNYLSQIQGYVDSHTKLYSEQPALQYTYFYFLTDILLDDSAKTSVEQERYLKKVQQVYQLLDAREEAKRSGIEWLKQVDNSTFCKTIGSFIQTPFEQSQCSSILDGQFRLGYRSSVFSFMYQFQQLRVKYEVVKMNQTKDAIQAKLAMLNNPEFMKFSVISNAYYQAQMHGLNDSLTTTLKAFFNQCILFVQLRIVFFVLFAFIIFAFLWRIFLSNIQAEVFRSKGMLNMIPTAFLEKDNNLRKLSLNKLVNLG